MCWGWGPQHRLSARKGDIEMEGLWFSTAARQKEASRLFGWISRALRSVVLDYVLFVYLARGLHSSPAL
jgi:hypothetical protein